jgi:DNA-nicking Smr family endonuclease
MAKVKTIDLHNYKLLEAENVFISYLNEARLKNMSIRVRCITGKGIIRDTYLKLSKEHNLNALKEGYGIITIDFE